MTTRKTKTKTRTRTVYVERRRRPLDTLGDLMVIGVGAALIGGALNNNK